MGAFFIFIRYDLPGPLPRCFLQIHDAAAEKLQVGGPIGRSEGGRRGIIRPRPDGEVNVGDVQHVEKKLVVVCVNRYTQVEGRVLHNLKHYRTRFQRTTSVLNYMNPRSPTLYA